MPAQDFSTGDNTMMLLRKLVRNTYEAATNPSGGGSWGSITGTLSDQTDLQNALNLKANLTANTFSRLQTITQGTANEGVLASTGYSITGANAQNMLDFSGTVNTSGAPTGLKLNIVNTASGAAANLFDFQTNGQSKLKFNMDGNSGLDFWGTGSNDTVFIKQRGTTLMRTAFSGSRMYVENVGFECAAGIFINNSSHLTSDAANVVAIKNNTTAQTVRIYGTTTGSNYLSLSHDGTDAIVGVNGGGALKIAQSAAQVLGFWGASGTTQPGLIPSPTGGGTTDAEARAAIDAILAVLSGTGLMSDV